MVTTLLHIPTRGFRAEIDTDEKGDSGNKGRTKLKPPSNIPHSVQRQIGAHTEEYAEGDPHLPTHNETTSDRSGNDFCRKNGDRRRFRTHTDAKQQTADKELFPVLAESGADDREKTKYGAEKDGTTTSDVEVEWIRQPATAVNIISQRKNPWEMGQIEHTTKQRRYRGRRSPNRQSSCSCHSLEFQLREEYRTL